MRSLLNPSPEKGESLKKCLSQIFCPRLWILPFRVWYSGFYRSGFSVAGFIVPDLN